MAPRNPPRERGLPRTPVRQSPTPSLRAGRPLSEQGSSPNRSPVPAEPGPASSLEDQLVAAQLLIAQLLKERETRVPPESTPEPAYRQDVLRPSVEAHSESSQRGSRDHQKLPDLPELDDGTNPTWISWKLQAEARLRRSYLFPDEQAKVECLYSKTKGLANKYLTPRMLAGSWTSAAEILEFLHQVFEWPDHGKVSLFPGVLA